MYGNTPVAHNIADMKKIDKVTIASARIATLLRR
jgi:hypothetical protein